MWIFIHALGIFCLTDLLKSVHCQKLSPTKNPECPGMHKAAQHVHNAILTLLQRSATCTVNKHCSGVTCKWEKGGILEVDLRHCENPVSYHLHFKSPDHHVDVEHHLVNDQSIKLYTVKAITFKIHMSELKRTGNTVTTKIDLLTCPVIGPCFVAPLLQKQKFCVSMRNCPGYNASSSEYAPCVANTSSPSQVPSTSTRGPYSGWSTKKHGDGTDGTADPANNHQQPKEKKGKLSVAAIIGIGVAGMFAVVIVVGVVVYWKKTHHRSRLRAAYYNDISMHDPLYEDFGPEVA